MLIKKEMRDVNIQKINLCMSSLEDAVLCGADCSHANFKGASLNEASFVGANIRWANFTKAIGEFSVECAIIDNETRGLPL